MIKYKFECLYCGKTWENDFIPMKSSCDKCGDTSIRVTDQNATKIDYYEGSPPFPDKDTGSRDWNF